MANYVWPPALPQVPQRGFSESVGANIIRTPTDQGPAKQRRRSLRPSTMGVSFLMTTAQVAILQDFLYDTLQCVKAFDFTHPRTGYTVNTRVVPGQDGELFKSTYAAPGYWTITLNFEILPTFITLSPGSYNIPINRISQFSRTTTATYIDGSGVLQTAPANVARYQGGQLLVEGEATNLCLQSQALNLSPWAGSVSASLAAETYREGPPFWVLSKTLALTSEGRTNTVVSVDAGVKVVWTFALLSGSVSVASFGLYDQLNLNWGSSSDAAAFIDDGPGTLFGQFGGRFDVSGLSSTVPTFIRVERTYAVAASVRIIIYPGRVASTTVGDSVKATRSQVCIGDAGGSYIPTTTAAVTRAADLAIISAT